MTDLLVQAPARSGSDFAPLLERVREHGLLRLRRRRYAVMITCDLLALTGVWAIIQVVGNTWWSLLLALPLAIFTVRMIFVAHDVGHRQVARTSRVNRVAGYVVGDVLLGLSARWWIDKHSRHHANPNQVGRDPDVGVGALCWTTEQAMGRSRLMTWLGRHQGRLFLPLLMLEALNLRKQVLTRRNVKGGRVTDWFLGGLNYQIEHHLFPGMPRPNLRHTQALVRAHCADLDVPYAEETLVTSFRITIRHLQQAGRIPA